MNFIDIAIIIVLLIFIIIGTWKGFIFSLVSVFSSTVNFFISFIICKPINSLLNSIFGIQSAITKGFTGHFTNLGSGFNTNLVGLSSSEINTHISNTLNNSSLSGFSKKLFSSSLKVSPEQIEGKEFISINSILSESLGTFFSIIISFIISFALIYLILWIINLIGKKVKEDGRSTKVVDRIFGFIFGTIKGALYISLFFAVLSFFNENGLLREVFAYIKASPIGNFAYTNINHFMDTYVNLKDLINSIISLFK